MALEGDHPERGAAKALCMTESCLGRWARGLSLTTACLPFPLRRLKHLRHLWEEGGEGLDLGSWVCREEGEQAGRQAWTMLPPSGDILLFLLVPG